MVRSMRSITKIFAWPTISLVLLGCSYEPHDDHQFMNEVVNSCFSTDAFNVSNEKEEEQVFGYLEVQIDRSGTKVRPKSYLANLQSPLCGIVAVTTDVSRISKSLDLHVSKYADAIDHNRSCDYDCMNREFVTFPVSARWVEGPEQVSMLTLEEPSQFGARVDFLSDFGGMNGVEGRNVIRNNDRERLLNRLGIR